MYIYETGSFKNQYVGHFDTFKDVLMGIQPCVLAGNNMLY